MDVLWDDLCSLIADYRCGLSDGLEGLPRIACGGGLVFQFSAPSGDLTRLDLSNVKSGVPVLKRVSEFLGFCPAIPCRLHELMW